jgi:hypothetical protein
MRVIEGKRPERPEVAGELGLTDSVWNLVEMCWKQEHEKRPTISYVLRTLRKAANLDPPTPPLEFSTVYSGVSSDASASSFSSAISVQFV